MTNKTPSYAQARELANLWSVTTPRRFVHGVNRTMDILHRNGWLLATGVSGQHPSGCRWEMVKISQAGEAALARYFAKRFGDGA